LKTSRPLVLFARLPIVLRNLRGKKSLREVAEGTGLAKEHLALLEPRPTRRRRGEVLEGRSGRTPRLDTLDVLLRYYGISLFDLAELLKGTQEATMQHSGSDPQEPADTKSREVGPGT
jgi:hypothetical protein